jgi:50S ribosomal protein L16 3-hydroxylase
MRGMNYTLNPNFDTTAFMRDYWGKKPLLIRQAFNFSKGVPVDAAQVLALAINPDAQARLIASKDKSGQDKWSLKRSPLAALPKNSVPNWTVLVQNVELASPAANQLLRQFAFARYAELDDLMVSYATVGGSVGAHVDSYDVFLLQAQGQRRWRISEQTDLAFVPKLPLKILQDFRAEQEWVLGPGDMLYLPPNVAHEGVAVGEVGSECLTYSIGYRAPRLHDALDDALGMLASEDGEDHSPQLKLPTSANAAQPVQPAQLTAGDVASYRAAMNAWLDDGVLEEHLGCVLTRPNREHAVPAPRAKLNAAKGISLPAGTRMLYSQGFVFIEGFAFAAQGSDWAVLSALANARTLPAGSLNDLSTDAQAIVQDWLQEGWCVQ